MSGDVMKSLGSVSIKVVAHQLDESSYLSRIYHLLVVKGGKSAMPLVVTFVYEVGQLMGEDFHDIMRFQSVLPLAVYSVANDRSNGLFQRIANPGPTKLPAPFPMTESPKTQLVLLGIAESALLKERQCFCIVRVRVSEYSIGTVLNHLLFLSGFWVHRIIINHNQSETVCQGVV